MAKKEIPSSAQAKMIAHSWLSGQKRTQGSSYIDPTLAACIKRGWMTPTGKTGKYPNGSDYIEYYLSGTALDALETFPREQRYRRTNQKAA